MARFYSSFKDEQVRRICSLLEKNSKPSIYVTNVRQISQQISPVDLVETEEITPSLVGAFGLDTALAPLLSYKVFMPSETINGEIEGFDLRDTRIDSKFRFTKLGGRSLFNHSTLKRSKNIIVTESVMDALSLRTALFDTENLERVNNPETHLKVDVVSTFSVKSSPEFLTYLASVIEEGNHVFFAFDGDQAGFDNTNKALQFYRDCGYGEFALSLNIQKCKDWNEVHTKYGIQEVKNQIYPQIIPFLK